ncbi:MAG: hypothetical protein GF388_09160 [Candidatus Aegiribacteria sp.]|nr:hypothetical protein [Candidatus Aegiribacteria sp.]MBD3295228.1 hypothetical protein [Candidatus Fermentibacteria bacterium]
MNRNKLIAAVLVLILMLFQSCNGEAAGKLMELSKERQCRANLNTLCTDQANYRDATGEWATDISQLDEFARRTVPLCCPSCGEEYVLEEKDDGYILYCPAEHGTIDTGRRCWTESE